MSQTKVQLVDFGSAVAASTPTNGPFISAANTVSISTNSTERFKISSTGEATVLGGNLTLNAQGDLRLADADSSNFIALQAPSTISSNVTLTLPSADGTNGQALTTNGSGTLSFTTISTTSDKITEGNTEAEVVDTGSDGHFKVITEGTERFRCDSSGRLLVGTSTARANFFGGSGTAMSQIEGTGSGSSASRAALSIINNNNNINESAYFVFGKSSGSSLGSNTLVANNEFLGLVTFQGSDGTKFVQAASIAAQVDGTPGVNDMPGRLVFSTTADGASSPTEAMRITNGGDLALGITTPIGTARLSVKASATANDIFAVQNNGGATVFKVNVSGHLHAAFLGVNTGTTLIVTASGEIAKSSSSIRYKQNVGPIDIGASFIKSLDPVCFTLIGSGQEQVGFIAEDFPDPRFVTHSRVDPADPDSELQVESINYQMLVAPLVKALQEAMERIETLEAKVAALEGA